MDGWQARWSRLSLLAATSVIAATCILDEKSGETVLPSLFLPVTIWVPLCAAVVLGCAIGIVRTHSGFWLTVPFTFWLLLGLANFPTDRQSALVASSWVTVCEGLLIAAVLLRELVPSSRRDILQVSATVLSGAMLVLFGAIHLTIPETIASLLPKGFPKANSLPYVSGTLQLLAGLALTLASARRAALLAMAAMYLAWLPLVHIPRLLLVSADGSEWRFALTAIALSAALAWLSDNSNTTKEAANENI